MQEVQDRPVDEIPGQTRHEAFVEEAGKAVGPMPPAVPDDDAPPPEELRIDGTTQLGMFDAGGKKPQSASIRLSGGKIELVDGRAFNKGDIVMLEVVAVVREVGQRDKPDPQTGIVVSCEQKHVAQITDVRVVESS